MRELVEKGQRVIMIPADFKFANKGTVTDVTPDGFTLELDYKPDGILRSNYCEFYLESRYGTLYFDSYPKSIDGKTLFIASPAKHKFLQRRQYTRVKYVHDLELSAGDDKFPVTTLDISAGGMKFVTNCSIDIDKEYNITLPLSDEMSVDCVFSPIRIEKNLNGEGGYTLSGEFKYSDNKVKLTIIQYCSKRSLEIANK